MKAVNLLQRIKLVEKVDYLLARAVEHKSPDKYQLKSSGIYCKKLLLAARTEKARKAAEYFIKIEEAIPEFYRQNATTGCTTSTDQIVRRVKINSFPIEQFTLTLTNQNASFCRLS